MKKREIFGAWLGIGLLALLFIWGDVSRQKTKKETTNNNI